MEGVALRQVDVADGVVHLIQIFFIVVRPRHTLQTADLTFRISSGHHLGLCNACIKLQLIGRIQTYHVAIGLVSLILLSEQGLYLSHDVPLAGFLLAAVLVAYHLAQIGHRLLILFTAQIVVGQRIVPILLGTIVHGVATLFDDQVFGIVEPIEFNIALRLPGTGNAVDGGLCLVEARHIREGCGGLFKLSLLKLRLAQQ